jgi:uncharacterized protein YndB with AHSA1/START domain
MGIHIDRSPVDVFAYVLDIERTPEWRPRMSGARWASAGEPGVGSRFEVDVRMLGYRFDFEFEVTAWDPPRFFAYSAKQGPVTTDSFMEWIPDGDGCRFSIGGDPRSTNRLILALAPFFRYSLIRQNMADLERLKAIMEAGGDRRPTG